MSDPSDDRYADRLETILTELHTVRDQVTAAAEEARGAHMQALKTNGRVDRAEAHVATLRQTVFGVEGDGVANTGGLVGWMRQTRREFRMLGATVVFVMPIVMLLLERWIA